MTALKFKNRSDLFKYIQEQEIDFIDFNFTDLRGAWHHITMHASVMGKSTFEKGITFDGSSIAGWQPIEASDMVLLPDLGKIAIDPFAAQKTLKIFCTVHEPESLAPYKKDPRSVAKSLERYLKNHNIADTAYIGPEPEFFVFDDVRYSTEPTQTGFHLNSDELSINDATIMATGNPGHRPRPKGGYVPEAPVDSLGPLRGEMLTVLASMGVSVEKHHHEVAPAQCELGIRFDTLLNIADNVQLYKYVVKNVAHTYGKTATFMPKPLADDNGSGMHCHQSLWKGSTPVFAGDKYANLSENALFYIGGILKHAAALCAFTNPAINSYKRLMPGYEAPVFLSYSAHNRSAACRIPNSNSDNERRIETRFPDPLANPYLAFAAMVMAGLDGIENKIHPGEAMDVNIYEIDPDNIDADQQLPESLEEALIALYNDQDFLLKGEVFSADLIESYIELKLEEIETYKQAIHPAEFKLYYSS